MNVNQTFHRSKTAILFFFLALMMIGLSGRLFYLMIYRSQYYTAKAEDLHLRERTIKAARGRILDRNGEVLADNRTVCTISVIHNQVKEPEKAIAVLSRELELSEETVRKKVEKRSSREVIATNVEKALGDKIRSYQLSGVKVDEDYKRYYPYDSLASKVLGFTGGDNQGIIGLEVKYEEYLQGKEGMILTVTDARGVEIDAAGEKRVESIPGNDLYISLDMNIQSYATQLAKQVMETKEAERVSILVMNPDVIILDEPTAGQDYRHYTEIMEFLKEINKNSGITIVMITHDMHLMLEYTDRALVIAEGQLLADEKPSEVLTDDVLTQKAYLKRTSLYDLAVGCGIEKPSDFVDCFIYYERENGREKEAE